MVKTLFWVAVGAAGALQADRWVTRKRARWSPNAVTGTLLDKVNEKLESNKGKTSAASSSATPRP